MQYITKREFGTILADAVLLPHESFEQHADIIATALNAAGYGIVKLTKPVSPEGAAKLRANYLRTHGDSER